MAETAEGGQIDELKRQATAWAEGFAAASGLEITVRVARDEPQGITIAFDGPDSAQLTGKRGEVLDALQLLASFSLKGRGYPRLHLLFDADAFREKREKVLTQMAQELAEEVMGTGQEAELEPLSALERRVIHQALLAFPGVRTYSEGDEPRRYIVIAPAE